MRTILRDLETVKGVRCGYVLRNGKILASSFPADQAQILTATQELAHDIVEGLALVEKGWEELLVDLGDTSLVVAPVNEGLTIALLVGNDANVDLLRVMLQSSARQVRTMLELPPPVPTPSPVVAKPAPAAETPAKPAAPAAPVPPAKPVQAPPAAAASRPSPPPQQPAKQPPPPPKPTPPQAPAAAARPTPPQQQPPARPAPSQPAASAAKPTVPAKGAPPAKPAGPPPAATPAPAAAPAARNRNDEDAEPLLPKVLDLLMGSIGPVARVTFKRGLSRWKESHAPTVGNLSSLAEILAADLSSDEERRSFIGAVERLRGN